MEKKLNGLKKKLNVIVFNRYYKFFFLLLGVPSFSFSIEPEDILVSDALSKPCMSGSMQEEDLIICVSKGYLLAKKN